VVFNVSPVFLVFGQFVGFSLIIRHVNGSAVDRKTAFVPSDKPF